MADDSANTSSTSDNSGKSGPTTTTKTTTSKVAPAPDKKGLVRVQLLASSWQRPKPGGGFRRFRQGAQLYVTQGEFDSLNGPHAFKPAFRVLDETADKE